MARSSQSHYAPNLQPVAIRSSFQLPSRENTMPRSSSAVRISIASLLFWETISCWCFTSFDPHHSSHRTASHQYLYGRDSFLLSLASQRDVLSVRPCEGMLDSETFRRYSQINKVLHHLRTQLPVLLFQPLTAAQQEVYASNFTLVGSNMEELASTFDELASLSTTLVAATAAARQANALVGMATSVASSNGQQTDDAVPVYVVQCDIALDSNDLKTVRVSWNTTLPVSSVITGLSEISLDDNGSIAQHQLLTVGIDGRTLSAVGETLASLRRTIRSLNDSPLLKPMLDSPLASVPVLAELRDGLLQQASSSQSVSRQIELPPVYATTSIANAFDASIGNSTTLSSKMTLLDDLSANIILPGSMQWTKYAAAHYTLSDFVHRGLEILSGRGTSTKDDFRNLFATDAKLLGVDGTLLAEGGGRIGDFYRTLASLRRGTAGTWEVKRVSADWNENIVTVSWVADSPVAVKGTDRFVLRGRSSFDADDDDDRIRSIIEKVEQVELVVSGNTVKDPEWFRAFFSSVERGRSSVVGGDLMVDLLQQAGKSPKPDPKVGPPRLSQPAAASVYGILCALHRDLSGLVDASGNIPPAQEYISPSIELCGYFDETIVRGQDAYVRVANVLSSSLRAALATNRVKFDSTPSSTIEFTSKGNINVSLTLHLRILVTQVERISLPLKLQVVSEYILNEKGTIEGHRLIESRVNGQLTPGDVVSRWIKGLPLNDGNGAVPTSLQSIMDAIDWVRILNSVQ